MVDAHGPDVVKPGHDQINTSCVTWRQHYSVIHIWFGSGPEHSQLFMCTLGIFCVVIVLQHSRLDRMIASISLILVAIDNLLAVETLACLREF